MSGIEDNDNDGNDYLTDRSQGIDPDPYVSVSLFFYSVMMYVITTVRLTSTRNTVYSVLEFVLQYPMSIILTSRGDQYWVLGSRDKR